MTADKRRKKRKPGSSPKRPEPASPRNNWIVTTVIGIVCGILGYFFTSDGPLAPLLHEKVAGILGPDPLLQQTQWPLNYGCDLVGVVAMPKGGKPLADLPVSLDEDPRVTAINAGASSWMSGVLRITWTAREGDAVVIDNVQPVQLRSAPTVDPAWLLQKTGSCGGDEPVVPKHPYRLDLDHGSFDKFDEHGRKADLDLVGKVVKVDQPLTIAIDVESCTGYYEWLLRITYSVGGNQYTRTIGTEGNPLRSAGGKTTAPAFESRPSATEQGRWFDPVAPGNGGSPSCPHQD